MKGHLITSEKVPEPIQPPVQEKEYTFYVGIRRNVDADAIQSQKSERKVYRLQPTLIGKLIPKGVLAMVTMEVFMDILAYHCQDFSMRWIAEKLGIHRNTVKRYITGKAPPTYRKNKRRESILTPYHQIIRDWLTQDDFKATWIFDKLKGLGYAGGYDTIRHFVRRVKAQKAQQAYIRFETEPGRRAQMDWDDFKILCSDGRHCFVYLFVLILGYSRALFAWLVERCTLESFMDGHIKAFAFFGGVSNEILYEKTTCVMWLPIVRAAG